jgi:hypothetical protein
VKAGIGINPNFASILGDTAAGPMAGVVRISFYYTGSEFELWFAASGVSYKIAVNDEWLADTPQSVGSTGQFYAKYTFATSERRRIDINIANPSFYGVTTELTGSIEQAPIRGPRIIAMTDSFGEGGPSTMIDYAGAALRIDDFWTSFVSGTGYIANGNGTKKTFRQRLALDVFPYNPSVVLICGSVNDDTQTYANLYAEAIALYAEIKTGLPGAAIVVCGSASRGAGTWMAGTSNKIQCNYAKRDACAAMNIPYFDFMDNGLPGSQPVNRLKANIAAPVNAWGVGGVTEIGQVLSLNLDDTTAGNLVNRPSVGSTYAIRQGTATEERFVITKVTSLTGTLVKLDADAPLRYAIAAGDIFTRVGNCPFTGSGYIGAAKGWGNSDIASSDGTHPAAYGHLIYGGWLANKLASLNLFSN